jgi:hypothetical protein
MLTQDQTRPLHADPLADEVAEHIAETRGQLVWRDAPVKQMRTLSKSVLDLGHGHKLSIEECNNGECWLYCQLNWFSGGHFVTCTMDEGKAMIRDMMVEDLEKSLAILKGAE